MLFIKFPLCIIGFCLTLTFICLSAALTFLPLIYLINLFVDGILISSGIPSAQSILIPTLLEIHGRFEPIMFFRSFAGVPLGLVCSFLTLQMIHGLARLSGLLANVMLGPGSQSYPMQPHIPTYAQPMLYQEQHMYVD